MGGLGNGLQVRLAATVARFGNQQQHAPRIRLLAQTLNGLIHGVEHDRLLMLTGPQPAERALNRVRVAGTFLQPGDLFSEGCHRGTAALPGDQRLDHGADLSHFLKHGNRDAGRLHGDDQCYGSYTCGNRVHNDVALPLVVQ